MCFELIPRHHNIARFRMGRPFPLDPLDKASLGSEYMLRMYKEACHWSSFTLNYIEWTYEYFVLDPPVPINCPIQGRYKFIQTGQEAEKYVFKMPGGMTPRPWLQVSKLTHSFFDRILSGHFHPPSSYSLLPFLWFVLILVTKFSGRVNFHNIWIHAFVCFGFAGPLLSLLANKHPGLLGWSENLEAGCAKVLASRFYRATHLGVRYHRQLHRMCGLLDGGYKVLSHYLRSWRPGKALCTNFITFALCMWIKFYA